MKLWVPFATAAVVLVGAAMIFRADWDLPPIDNEQVGYRGTGLYVQRDREKQAELREANIAPEPLYEALPDGDRAGDIYENVQVLGDLSDDQFNLFMAQITEWVSPVEGCGYCHNLDNLASDEVYTKVVARRMIQMNQTINVDWQAHVADTGVTCYTCHRGQPVPAEVWFRDMGPKPAGGPDGGMVGWRDGQNVVGEFVGRTSMPQNALENYLLGDKEIRVHALEALPTLGTYEDGTGTKETEGTWALMMHMSESLGANCSTCHNSRAFNDWDQSPPQRVTAWHGIRMARELNSEYMVGLTPIFPDNRKGPEGDVYKIGCATCHNGVQKPLYGVSMLQEFVDSLGTRTNTEPPDVDNYVPGETQIMMTVPPQSSSLLPTGAENEVAVAD